MLNTGYAIASMSIVCGRLMMLHLLDQETLESVEIAHDGSDKGRYTICISSENNGVPRRLNEADVARFGKYLPDHVISSASSSGFGGWLRDKVANCISSYARDDRR